MLAPSGFGLKRERKPVKGSSRILVRPPAELAGARRGDHAEEDQGGLMESRLCVDARTLGRTKLTDWLEANRERLGRQHASELAR